MKSIVQNDYGMSQALLPLKQLRDNRRRELKPEQQEVVAI